MAPLKFVIKCGNFAVLVDLHVLPLGGQVDASWFTTDHVEEVTALVRDAVDQRVKQYADSLHNRKQAKQKKELAPAAALSAEGKSFSLVANFLKRHFNLRCIVKQLYGDLRVFPERYVVCVSRSEDASALHGNPSLAAAELKEQSTSEYFSRAGETQEALNSCTKTKKTALQKIAKQASVQRELYGSMTGEQLIDQRDRLKGELRESNPKETASSSERTAADHEEPFPRALNEAVAQSATTRKQESLPDRVSPHKASLVDLKLSQETSKSKRSKPSDAGEDLHPQRAKRTCLGRPPGTMQTRSNEGSSQTSKHDLLPLQPLPPAEAGAEAESKAFPVSECSETTLEVELLTPGKQAQRLPLTSNNTAQTNQNRLAASLRGLSVKPASSGSSISSRSTLGEEGSENVPRTSRLRRQKRS
ncbi:protein SLX4IP [Notolabrus celidotus]|uniref:protein SLX4IP n=1 Tax=Notolabrus celidotus TaxID=1203425 RepID=UPI0014901010|nr:protein SLX4IP [Notolabrus celidotus]XP_034537410.1 protein SLX4IP [Notolabrus celidotus]XP_034537411.1 protein SLX4IP [Notolabrus celidotus]